MSLAFAAMRSCARSSLMRASSSRMVATSAPALSPAMLHLQAPKKKLGLRQESTTPAPAPEPTSIDLATEANTSLGHRFKYTAEVLVSKIFPAGFGWQAGSCVAGNSFGLSADSLSFSLCCGVGDGGAVFLGHTAFYTVKSVLLPHHNIKIGSEMQVAAWLGTAAFMAGTSWQLCVNVLVGLGCGFNSTFLMTGACTGFVFMAGLRFGRHVYSGFTCIPAPDKANLATDIMLSTSIGGGLAAFVGTDVSFGDANWLRPLFGVEDTFTDLRGCYSAGASTFVGFGAVQAVENVFVPQGRCWND